MKMEVRVFTASPILVDEITDWFKSQEPRIPITVSVVERTDESRIAVYALFLDAPVVVTSAAVGDAVLGTGLETEALDLLDQWAHWMRSMKPAPEAEELHAKTAELLKKAGRA